MVEYELCGLLISELSDIGTMQGEELSSDALFLISQPYSTQKQYISRKLKYGELANRIEDDLSVKNLCSMVMSISEWQQRQSQTSSILSCNSPFPYILSSYQFLNGGLISAEGYPLSSGMETVLKHMKIETVNLVSADINKLSARQITVKSKGVIEFDGDGPHLKNSNQNKCVEIEGGNSYYGGAGLVLYGKSNSNNGGFVLYAANSDSNHTELEGTVDGTLKWNGQELVNEGNIGERVKDQLSGSLSTYLSVQISSQISTYMENVDKEEWTFEYEDDDGETQTITKVVHAKNK